MQCLNKQPTTSNTNGCSERHSVLSAMDVYVTHGNVKIERRKHCVVLVNIVGEQTSLVVCRIVHIVTML